MRISRRELILAASAAALPLQAAKLKSIGAQLYTLRSILPKQPLETLKALEAMGYTEVEAVSGDLPKIWDALKQTKLKPVSVHLDAGAFLSAPDKIPAMIDDSKARGFKFVVCPYVPPNMRSADNMRKLGETLNKAGELARAAGMTLCYHNHAFEFAPLENTTIFDRMMAETDPKLVQVELDIMWVKVAGLDPVAAIQKYSKRISLLHLKNVSEGIPQRFDERVPREAFQEVGKGAIQIAPVLKAAAKAGVKNYFVEQDQTPGDPLASLKGSINYLTTLDY
ncbi:MAG: TIM barrel protein [Bryobacteraceae bacterium]|nr:TIM barrel protein [Bryobacteraceae bacterium]